MWSVQKICSQASHFRGRKSRSRDVAWAESIEISTAQPQPGGLPDFPKAQQRPAAKPGPHLSSPSTETKGLQVHSHVSRNTQGSSSKRAVPEIRSSILNHTEFPVGCWPRTGGKGCCHSRHGIRHRDNRGMDGPQRPRRVRPPQPTAPRAGSGDVCPGPAPLSPGKSRCPPG